MSNKTFNDLWHSTQKLLENLAVNDYQKLALDPEFDRPTAQRFVFELYVKYIQAANRLETIYDEMVQPQKRMLIRKLLDSALGRIIELKQDLVSIDMMEFSYNDEVIKEMKIVPHDIELRIPRYFLRENQEDILYKKKFIDDILLKLGWLDEEVVEEKMSELQAIQVIQMHERARQGRLRAEFMKEIKQLKEKGKPDTIKGRTDGLMAAMRIQKVWRGFTTRRKTKHGKLEEMYLIGMVPRPNQQNDELIEKERMRKDRRYAIQEKNKNSYENALKEAKEDIMKKYATTLSEQIADEVRNWFREYQNRVGKFPEFPSAEHGGSRQLLSRQDSEVSRSSPVSSKDSRKTKDKSKTPTKVIDLTAEVNFESGFKMNQSYFLNEIKIEIDEYNDVWKEKDESMNVAQGYYKNMIYTDKYAEAERELRVVIDDLMRQELELLQAALERDRSQKGKKSKKASKKARRSGKKNKKKKEKDLTPDRTTESLFEELITNGIIKKVPERRLNSFLGDRAYAARSGLNPTPGDIRQVLTEYAILPLGSETIRSNAPCIRSIMIAGPKGSGKKTLVQSICNEVGAVLFDLTPANIVGKYPGKSGLIMLMHLVLKVSRLLQPCVIFMDNAETPFMKKVPKGDRTDPKRLKKDLPKLIKNIAEEDRVLFIGTSFAPWEADQKLLQQAYNRFIYIPKPDYGTLSFVWQKLLQKYNGIAPSFDYGSIARLSDGYTIGSIVQCLNDVLTCKRILQFRVQPLAHVELISALSSREPVYREEEESFTAWWSKTPLGRRNQKAIEMEIQAKLEKESGADKKRRK